MKFGKYRSGAAVYRRVKISSSSTLDLVLSASNQYLLSYAHTSYHQRKLSRGNYSLAWNTL